MTIRAITLLLIGSSLFFASPRAEAFTKLSESFKSVFKSRNPPASTEARVPIGCTSGMCHKPPFKNDPIEPIPREGLAGGVARVLATVYGACDAARPLNAISMDAVTRNKAMNTYRATNDKAKAQNSGWQIHVPGFREANRDLREISNPAQYNSAGPYAAAMRGRVCRSNPGFNVSSAPKTFGYGASGKMHNGEYNILRCGQASYFNSLSPAQKAYKCGLAPNSKPAITIDCAEFIGAATIASCKKLHKNQTVDGSGFKFPGGRELSTGAMVAAGKEGGGSCISNKPTIGPDSSIQAGDIFAGSSAHSVMITRVGNDPLGIAKAKRRAGGCSSLSYSDMDFDMAHSPSHAGIGPINSSARAYANLIDRAQLSHPYPLNKILAMAITLCNQQSVKSAHLVINDPKFSLLRHKSGDPDCSYSKDKCPKLAGDECADECGV